MFDCLRDRSWEQPRSTSYERHHRNGQPIQYVLRAGCTRAKWLWTRLIRWSCRWRGLASGLDPIWSMPTFYKKRKGWATRRWRLVFLWGSW